MAADIAQPRERQSKPEALDWRVVVTQAEWKTLVRMMHRSFLPYCTLTRLLSDIGARRKWSFGVAYDQDSDTCYAWWWTDRFGFPLDLPRHECPAGGVGGDFGQALRSMVYDIFDLRYRSGRPRWCGGDEQ